MARTPRKNDVFANPFYLILILASTLFVVTTLGYLVAPYALEGRPNPEIERAPQPQGAASRAFAAWLDRHGPLALGLEFLVMLVTGVLAMVTDDWFSPAKGPSTPSPSPRGPS
jgi:hypothetical protein